MSNRLEGKVAVITGGSTGIGFATAKRFIEEGATVYITGRREKELNDAVEKLGERAIGVQGDVSQKATIDDLYFRVQKEQGRLDIVFANAGVANFEPLGQIEESSFDRDFGINVKGVLFTAQGALPLLNGKGSIIINGSIVASRGMAGSAVYSATKAAVRSFARVWASDLKETEVRVNVISPGPVVTEGFEALVGGEGGEQREGLRSLVPLGRLGRPDEIASAALFLASDESSFVTGTELFVDGGAAQV